MTSSQNPGKHGTGSRLASNRKLESQKGFTLLEMVVVLAILAILSAYAYPRIAGYMKENREQYRANHEYMVNKALMQYYAMTGDYYRVSVPAGTAISDEQAAAMVKKLNEVTGALIEDPTGVYDYVVAEGSKVPGTNTWTVRSVKVKAG